MKGMEFPREEFYVDSSTPIIKFLIIDGSLERYKST